MHDARVTMSDNSDSGSDDPRYNGDSKHVNGKDEDNICRDFLRNVCKRGKRCRYRHPSVSDPKDLGKKLEFTFCHDYQNTGCRRATCKFLHCTRDEEEHYLKTAQLPLRLQQQAALGMGVAAHSLPILKGEVPICKDFLKRECKRGAKCKYRHLSGPEYEFEVNKGECRTPRPQSYGAYEDDTYDRFDYSHGPLKRRRLESDGFHGYPESRYPPIRPLSLQMVEEENGMLRRKVEELKKQVADLTATNEVLLEQNARYRVSKSAAAVMSPAVTVAGAPGTQLNHLTTSLSQQIALNSEMATQHALQTAQRIAREMVHPQPQTALAAAAAAAAQTINPSVTLNPPNMVSLQQNPLQGTRSMSQTMAAAQNTSLVSYPIVSQSMRVAGVPSSLAH